MLCRPIGFNDEGVNNRVLLWVAGGAALLASCVATRTLGPPLVVSVKREGDGCQVSVQGERVTSDRLLEIGRAAAKRPGIVVYAKDAPYKCVGGAVFTLQRAGMMSVQVAMWDDS